MPDGVHPITPETKKVLASHWVDWMKGGTDSPYDEKNVLQRNRYIEHKHDNVVLFSKYDQALAYREFTYSESTPVVDDQFDTLDDWDVVGTAPTIVAAPWDNSQNAVCFDTSVGKSVLNRDVVVSERPVVRVDFYLDDDDLSTGVVQQLTLLTLSGDNGQAYGVGIVQTAGGSIALRGFYNRFGYNTTPIVPLPVEPFFINKETKYTVEYDVIQDYVYFAVNGSRVYAVDCLMKNY